MTAKELIRKNLNVPNVLTMIRLLLVPVYVVLFVSGQKYAALVTFLAASLTDLLDGRIARKYNLITDFGKLVDPFADKVMVLTALLSMAIGSSAIPPVVPWVAVIILLMATTRRSKISCSTSAALAMMPETPTAASSSPQPARSPSPVRASRQWRQAAPTSRT